MTDNVSAEQLRQYIERIETLLENKKGISDDIKDVFAEAKSTGFDPKTMKTVIKLRALDKDTRDNMEAMLETYLSALSMQ